MANFITRYIDRVKRWKTSVQDFAAWLSDSIVKGWQSLMNLSNAVNPLYQVIDRWSKLITWNKKWILTKGMDKVNDYIDKTRNAWYTWDKNSITSKVGRAVWYAAPAIATLGLGASPSEWVALSDAINWGGGKVISKIASKFRSPLSSDVVSTSTNWKFYKSPTLTNYGTAWVNKIKTAAKWLMNSKVGKVLNPFSALKWFGEKSLIGKAWAIGKTVLKNATSTAWIVGWWAILNKVMPDTKSDADLEKEFTYNGQSSSPTTPVTPTQQELNWREWQDGWQVADPNKINNKNNQSAGGNHMTNVSGTSYNESNTAPTWGGTTIGGTTSGGTTTGGTTTGGSNTVVASMDKTQSLDSVPDIISKEYQKLIFSGNSLEDTDKYYYDSWRKLNEQRAAQWMPPLDVPPPSVNTDSGSDYKPMDVGNVEIKPETDLDYQKSSANLNSMSTTTTTDGVDDFFNKVPYRLNPKTGIYEIKSTIALTNWDMWKSQELMSWFDSSKSAGSGVGMKANFGISQDLLNQFLWEVINGASSRFVPSGVWKLNWLIDLLKQQTESWDILGSQDTYAQLKIFSWQVADQLKSRLTPLYKDGNWGIDWDKLRGDPIYALADKVFNWSVKVKTYYNKDYSTIVNEAKSIGTTTYDTWYKSVSWASSQRKSLMIGNPLYRKYLEMIPTSNADRAQLEADYYKPTITDLEKKFLSRLKTDVYQAMKDWFNDMMESQWYDAAKAAYPMNSVMKDLVNVQYRTNFDDLLEWVNFWTGISSSWSNTSLEHMYASNNAGYTQKINSFQGIV